MKSYELLIFIFLVILKLISCEKSLKKDFELKEPDILDQKIINGENAKKRYPFMIKVQILKEDGRTIAGNCGAAFISKNWAISAAHCFPKVMDGRLVRFSYGNFKRSDCQEIISIGDTQKLKTHENYDPETNEHDIALIKISHYDRCFDESFPRPNKFRSILRISNDTVGSSNDTERYNVAGWGIYDTKQKQTVSKKLQYTKIKFSSTVKSYLIRNFSFTNSEFF